MEGKRFGIGLAAGLLLGIAIISASGGMGSFSTVLVPASHSGVAITTTSARSAVTTMTSTASQTATAITTPAYGVVPGNVSQASTTSAGTTPSAAMQKALSNLSSLSASGANGPPPSFSSRVQNIPGQPPFANAVILLPVLVALLLGAIFYRASNRSGEQPSEERP